MMMPRYSSWVTRRARRSCLSFVSSAWRNLSIRSRIDVVESVRWYSLGCLLAGKSPAAWALAPAASRKAVRTAAMVRRVALLGRLVEGTEAGAAAAAPACVDGSLQTEGDPRSREPVLAGARLERA